MESEAAKKAESILKAAQSKIAAGGLSAEDEAIYNKAIVKAEAEIAFFKDKKPFSWKDLVPKVASTDDDPVVPPTSTEIVDPTDDDKNPLFDFTEEEEAENIKARSENPFDVDPAAI